MGRLWFVSLLVATLNALLAAGMGLFLRENLGATNIALIAGMAGLVSFFLSYVLIKRFIYSKIKPIYKIIYDKKATVGKSYEKPMDNGVLEELEQEVREWDKQRQSELIDLRSQEKFRREFIGNLAHELKTPIFSIQGYILTLLEGALNDPDINRKFLLRAAKGVDRMTRMIEDLDVITKLESDRLELEPERFDITELARDIIEDLEMKAKAQNVSVRFEKPDSRGFWVNGDKDKISQVLSNLIVNSINYGKDGGETEIRFSPIDDRIMVEVADNGNGITEENKKRIFERFYRVDKSRSRNAGGTGLGLAIVKHIIEKHGQQISVRSTPGVGSTFTFTLEKA